MTPLIAMPAPVHEPAEPGAHGGATDALPELPVLSALLQGATRLPVAADWRGGVLAALDLPAPGAIAPAAVAACAIPDLPQDACACMATPVHVVAGISRMFLGHAASFVLTASERETLRQAFNAEFGAPAMHLHAVGSGWLLQAEFAAAAADGSPESLLGMALAREPAVAGTQRALRRLGAEVEMWLAGLPLNRDRERRGAPPINCIWFWGGARTGPLPRSHLPGGLFSNIASDAWLAGLAAHCGMPLQHAQGWDDVRGTAGAVVVLQPPVLGDALQQLPAWEEAWLAPARRDLQARRLPALRLQVGASAWQLPAPRLTRWLRRAQPWWQAVSA
jgi:hypothetical protein